MKENIDFKGDIVTLACDNKDHQLLFGKHVGTNDIVCRVNLVKSDSFIRRLRLGLKYIFTAEKNTVYYDDFIFHEGHRKYLLEVIAKLSLESPLVKHAVKEFEIAGNFTGDLWDLNEAKRVIELLSTYSTHNPSWYAGNKIITTLKRLINFDTISPLTFKDDEWHTLEEGDSIMHNKRCGRILKNALGVWDTDAFLKNVTSSKPLKSDKPAKIAGGQHRGFVFESRAGVATGRGFRYCFFKEKDIAKGVMPKKTVLLPTTEIEVSAGQWLMFTDFRSSALKELASNYDIQWFEVPELKNKVINNITETYGY